LRDWETISAPSYSQIGDDFAVGLYRYFVVDSLAMLRRSGIPFVVCFHPADKLKAFEAWLGA